MRIPSSSFHQKSAVPKLDVPDKPASAADLMEQRGPILPAPSAKDIFPVKLSPQQQRLRGLMREQERKAYFSRLDAWAQQGAPDEQRLEAVDIIKHWVMFCTPNKALHLVGLGLTSLPELPENVLYLVARNNRLAGEIKLPAKVISADLSHNQLDVAPKLPSGANNVNIEHNQLRYLPSEYSELAYLNADFNPLGWNDWAIAVRGGPTEKRAEAVARMRAWIQLNDPEATLDLSGLGLTTLPPFLPDNITILDASNNPDLVHSEDFPDSLKIVYVSPYNPSRSFNILSEPEEGLLSLRINEQLPECKVFITSPFSDSEYARLQENVAYFAKLDRWAAPKTDENADYFAELDAWVHGSDRPADEDKFQALIRSMAPRGEATQENRLIAVARIKQWVMNNNSSALLDLSGLGLTRLPKLPPNVKLLSAENNQLRGSLILQDGIKVAFVGGNRLFSLSHRPASLESLFADFNPFPLHDWALLGNEEENRSQVVDAITAWERLADRAEALDLRETNVFALPECIPDGVTVLNVANNPQLSRLPNHLPTSLKLVFASSESIEKFKEHAPDWLKPRIMLWPPGHPTAAPGTLE